MAVHTLIVDGYLDATGSYSFRRWMSRLLHRSARPPVTGTLPTGQETALYRFDATAGDRFFFDQQEGDVTEVRPQPNGSLTAS